MPVVSPESVAEVLGLDKSVRSVSDLEQAVCSGLPKKSLERLSHLLWSEEFTKRNDFIYMFVPLATWKRRGEKLSVAESEKTERVARLLVLAEQVLNEKEFARAWMTRPHPELGGKSPVEAAKTELGARRVEDILMRVLFGLPV